MTTQAQKKTASRTFWAAITFYLLIAFEFFYMASPFALYFYSIYRPGMNMLNQIPGVAWLVSFFLPHIVVETASPLINAHNIVGGILAVGGFLAFCIGAAQVYYHKLARKGAVIGGVYNVIRHPQYASFALCSFGLLLLWPRFIALIFFITLLFAYYFLARVEEKECEDQFGQSYIAYKNKTHMFLPFRIPFADRLPALPKSRLGKGLAVAGLYLAVLAVSVGAAVGLQTLALDSLYASYTPDAATISVGRIEAEKLQRVIDIAMQNPAVRAHLAGAAPEAKADTRYINYVLPTAWYAAEIPMQPVPGARGHSAPAVADANQYKMIFMRVDVRDPGAAGKQILLTATGRMPLAEVWVDLSTGVVTRISTPTVLENYQDVPVPLY